MLYLHWIPDQVRNDKTATYAFLAIVTQPRKRESRERLLAEQMHGYAGMTKKTPHNLGEGFPI
jgi:hypothetical protein